MSTPSARAGDAYATLVYGDGIHSCAAAVWSRLVGELDDTRARVVLASNVSGESRRILSSGGLTIVDATPIRQAAARKVGAHLALACGEPDLCSCTLLATLPLATGDQKK